MLTLVLVVLLYFSKLDDTVDIQGLEIADDRTFVCVQDQLANQVLTQLVIEFVVPKVFLLGEYYVKKLIFALRKKRSPATYFKVEKQAIHLIYFQAISWILIPYFPLAAVIIAIMLPP